MTRSPLIPTLALMSALLLAACGGGGGNPDDLGGGLMKTCPDGSTVLRTESCPESAPPPGETSPAGGNGRDRTTGGGDGGGNGPTETTDRTTSVTLASLCTSTSCRGVFWSGTAGTLDRNAITRSSNDPYDHDRDPETPDVIPAPYQFQASYSVSGDDFPADDPMTDDKDEFAEFINALNDAIALIEQDVRYAQFTVDAVVDLVGRIRTGREGEDLGGTDENGNEWWSAASEIRSLIQQNKVGAPVAAFSAKLPLTEIKPVAQIIGARGISHDLRGAADEDVAAIDTLLRMIAEYEKRAMAARDAINARLIKARADVGRLRAGIATQMSRAVSKEAEITTAANDAKRLSAELFGDEGNQNRGGLELEWARLNGAIQAFDQGSIDVVFTSEDLAFVNCNSENSCRQRLADLGTFDSDTNSIVGGLVETKRMELTSKQADLRNFRAQLATINAEVARLRAAVQPNNQLLSDLVFAASEIAYSLRLIAAAEGTVTAQQAADKDALAALAADIESIKAAIIRTALEGIINATGATDPARARFARNGNLADLATAGDAVFARAPNAANDASPPATYADYGMWLTGTDAEPVLETRMGLVDPDGNAPGPGDLTTPGTATYNGTAHGLAARTQLRGGTSETASGHFTAAVRLNATFGDNPQIGGTVTNFQAESGQGSAHVSSAWTIDLRPTVPRGGNILNAPFGGTGTGHPTDGGWSAYAYGAAGDRPIGIYGGFEADFDDGAAIGQFDTKP